MKVLDKGEIVLINFMGGDDAVVASARVSNGALYEDSSKGEEKDKKLIKFLITHNHETPFEHSVFTFYIKAPIFVAREWFRHRIGSFNEISGRYVEFEEEFYIPDKLRVPGTTNKQGSVFPVGSVKEMELVDWEFRNIGEIQNLYNRAYLTYLDLLNQGVAKEMARMVLPLGLYTQFYWTVNARALMNFIRLRIANDAQYEIRQYASIINKILQYKMPWTWEAFVAMEVVSG